MTAEATEVNTASWTGRERTAVATAAAKYKVNTVPNSTKPIRLLLDGR